MNADVLRHPWGSDVVTHGAKAEFVFQHKTLTGRRTFRAEDPPCLKQVGSDLGCQMLRVRSVSVKRLYRFPPFRRSGGGEVAASQLGTRIVDYFCQLLWRFEILDFVTRNGRSSTSISATSCACNRASASSATSRSRLDPATDSPFGEGTMISNPERSPS